MVIRTRVHLSALMQFTMNDKLIFESPDGGKTVYARKSGETERHLYSVNPEWKKQQIAHQRWVDLKEAVYMAEFDDPTLNDVLTKLEMLYALKKK